MRIAIISEYNIFTTTGGTEYYVDLLLKGLCKAGHELLLVTKGKQVTVTEKRIQKEGTAFYKILFLPADRYSKAATEQKVVSASWEQMLPELEKFDPDLIHVHTLTTFFNIRHFELCTSMFQPVFLTTHIPGNFCAKGDLIRNNRQPCDGLIADQCSVCLFSKSMKAGIANLVFHHYQKPLELLQLLKRSAVQIVCVSDWQKMQLVNNGYPANMISVIRQALVSENYQSAIEFTGKRKFSIGYLGRLSPEKGSALLLQLIRQLKGDNEICFVLGIPANSNQKDIKALKQLMNDQTPQIKLFQNIDADNKHTFFEAIDCLLIPSFFIETGPIVLLEAIMYKKSIIAPAVGGPLEFATEFPGEVVLYPWNDLSSVVDSIKKLKQQKIQPSTDKNLHFAEKENLFITGHLTLYQEAINLQPTNSR